MDKYLICSDIHSKEISYVVPEEIEENVKKAVSNYKAKEVKEWDRISYCEMQVVVLGDNVISYVGALKSYDLTELFKLMDEAIDEMPSGVLNGLTPIS